MLPICLLLYLHNKLIHLGQHRVRWVYTTEQKNWLKRLHMMLALSLPAQAPNFWNKATENAAKSSEEHER